MKFWKLIIEKKFFVRTRWNWYWQRAKKGEFIISPNLTLELKSFHPLRIHAHMHTRTHTRTHTHMRMHTPIPEGTRTNTHSCSSVHSLSFECTQPLSFTLSLSHTLYLSFSLKTHTASCSNDTPCFTLPKFQQQPPTPLISHFSVCSLYHEDTEPRWCENNVDGKSVSGCVRVHRCLW